MNRKPLAIKVKVLSPLLQIDEQGTTNKRKRLIKIDRGEGMTLSVAIPFYSGNAVKNGLLRRPLANLVYGEAVKKGVKIDPEDFFLAFAGGSLNIKTSLDFDSLNNVKAKNKVISLLGSALLFRSKIAVSDFTPEIKDGDKQKSWQIVVKQNKNDDSYFANSALICKDTNYKVDDIERQTQYATALITKEDIAKWMHKLEEERGQRKEDKKNKEDGVPQVNGEENTKKTDTANVISTEYIIPGAVLCGSIGFNEDLDDVEYGLLLLAIKEMVNKNLGAKTQIGYGVVDYEVFETDKIGSEDMDTNELLIYSITDTNYILADKKIYDNFSEEHIKCIEKAQDWIKNITAEQVNLYPILKKEAKVKKEKHGQKQTLEAKDSDDEE